MKSKIVLSVSMAIFIMIITTSMGFANNYPQRPINVYVPLSAGGTADLFIRTIAPHMEKFLGQPMVIVNRPGSGGAIAVAAIYKEKPDGYSFTFANLPALVTVPQMRKVPYNPSELVYIASPMRYEYILFVKNDAPWNSLEEFISASREKPGSITYGTPGNGSTNHLAMEWLAKEEGVKMRAVPFQGNPQSISAVLGGHIQAVNASTAAAVSSYRAGLIKPLAVLSADRIALVPETPTLKEMGYDFYQYSNLGAVFPPETPETCRKRIEDAIAYAVSQPDVIEKAAKDLFISIDFKTGEQYRAKCEEFTDVWGKILDDVGLKKK